MPTSKTKNPERRWTERSAAAKRDNLYPCACGRIATRTIAAHRPNVCDRCYEIEQSHEHQNIHGLDFSKAIHLPRTDYVEPIAQDAEEWMRIRKARVRRAYASEH